MGSKRERHIANEAKEPNADHKTRQAKDRTRRKRDGFINRHDERTQEKKLQLSITKDRLEMQKGA